MLTVLDHVHVHDSLVYILESISLHINHVNSTFIIVCIIVYILLYIMTLHVYYV